MQIGIPRETKPDERRVALTPSAVRELADAGHELRVERDAGAASGFADAEYAAAGATLTTADNAWAAELVLKVKEPIEPEYRRFHEGLVLFTYLHLAADPALTEALVAAGVTAVPLARPASCIAAAT
jgi:alanine dehydrogenase